MTRTIGFVIFPGVQILDATGQTQTVAVTVGSLTAE